MSSHSPAAISPKDEHDARHVIRAIRGYVEIADDAEHSSEDLRWAKRRLRGEVVRFAIMAYGRGASERELEAKLEGAVWLGVERAQPRTSFLTTYGELREFAVKAALLESVSVD
jgi:alkyl sulfatase BDS1-like metallo-beta-lactamase superfamily hydrolase